MRILTIILFCFMILTIIIAAAAFIIGGFGGYLVFRYILKGKYNEMLEAAAKEADVMKEKKLLEVKEKFLNKKSELEKEVQVRNQHIQQSENKLKQRELSLNQRQEELGRRKNDLDNQQVRIDNEKKLLQMRSEELEKMQLQERDKLEELSGLSAEEAKQRLVEAMKDEAKTDAQSYINEIMDEAKLNANAQARKIVIQTIQRVATETAIENSVSVFHIDNDEVKGRIIGREGRNIRALEAATGVEIVVDDTPEAIVISAFDPIRREVCRLWGGHWGYKVLNTAGFSYNNHPCLPVYESQTNAGPCFFCRKQDFLGIHYEDEMWLDGTYYAFPDDQVMFYKMYRCGLRVLTSFDSGIVHLDTSTTVADPEEKTERLIYSEYRNKLIFWHRFIFQPERKILKRAWAIAAISYAFGIQAVKYGIKYLIGSKRMPAAFKNGVADGLAFIRSDAYKNLPKIQAVR